MMQHLLRQKYRPKDSLFQKNCVLAVATKSIMDAFCLDTHDKRAVLLLVFICNINTMNWYI